MYTEFHDFDLQNKEKKRHKIELLNPVSFLIKKV